MPVVKNENHKMFRSLFVTQKLLGEKHGCGDLCQELFRTIHTARNVLRSYYDLLGVGKDCSSKEIKAAYVRLCKEHHPDKQQNASSKKFVELNEAYTTLIKPYTRAAYDNRLRAREYSGHPYEENLENLWRRHGEHTSTAGNRNYKDFYAGGWHEGKMGFGAQYSHQGGYRPAQPFQNLTVVCACLMLIFIGMFLHTLSYRYNSAFSYEKMDEKSRVLLEKYSEIRKNAMDHGNERQMATLLAILKDQQRQTENESSQET